MPFKSTANYREYIAHRRYHTKERIQEIKKESGGCKWCGWNEHPEILHFHHRDPETKRWSFSYGGVGNYKWENILEEIAKCDLICPNCHMWFHWNEQDEKEKKYGSTYPAYLEKISSP